MYREFKEILNKGDIAIIFWDKMNGYHTVSDNELKFYDFKDTDLLKNLKETKYSFRISYGFEDINGLSRAFRTLKATYVDWEADENVEINLDNEYYEYTFVDGFWDWRKFEGDIKNVG